MIEYLEKLVEDGEYTKGLTYAEQLLMNRDFSPTDVVAIHCAILRCRYYLNEFHGALMSGQLVLKLAEDLDEWDYYGTACLYVGLVYDRIGQSDAARMTCYSYLANVHHFSRALRHRILVWFNLGIYNAQLGDGPEAIRAFNNALELAIAVNNKRFAHGIRHGLIQAFMQLGRLEDVPSLLAKCLHYLRSEVNSPYHLESLLYHYHLRAEFALLTNRLERALAVAHRGLHYAVGQPVHLYHLYMICARVSIQRGNTSDAIMHSLSARLHAIQVRRFELEAAAAEFMYKCTKADNAASRNSAVDYAYPAIGQGPLR